MQAEHAWISEPVQAEEEGRICRWSPCRSRMSRRLFVRSISGDEIVRILLICGGNSFWQRLVRMATRWFPVFSISERFFGAHRARRNAIQLKLISELALVSDESGVMLRLAAA
ncbi:hypothetical protein AB0F72_14090 [Actinoplanes sp. NPDC023936]|uniref:hypothetical protein n=1 Tax=Actinoplanes sp. NPDC023936 TaxID=3154910 RepID=UPI0033E65711